MKSGGSKKRKKGKWREGNIKTAKEKNDHARTNYFIVVVVVFLTKSLLARNYSCCRAFSCCPFYRGVPKARVDSTRFAVEDKLA